MHKLQFLGDVIGRRLLKGERTKLSKKEDNFFLDPDPFGDIWYIKYDLFDSSSKF